MKLNKVELKELILTLMVGSSVRSAVAELDGEDWEKIEDQYLPFLELARNLGYSDLIENFKGSLIPSNKLCKKEEEILSEFTDDEFWNDLEIRLGQRDFTESLTKEELEKIGKNFWLPDKVHGYYKKYEKEFEKYGIQRLRIINKKT